MQKLQYMKYKQNLKPETCGCGVDLFSVWQDIALKTG